MAYIAHAALLALGVFGYVALHHFANSNGFFDLITAAVENGVYSHKFTPVPAVNDACNFFVAFFWPCVDGNHPGLSLASFVFAGQMVAGWGMVMMEAYRAGNSGRAISFVAVFGMICQGVGLGVCAPLYLLAHLVTSPTATKPSADNVAIPDNTVLSLFPAIAIGMILPTVAESLPTPQILSVGVKTTFVLLWQFFPIWSSLLCMVFSQTFSELSTYSKASTTLRATYVLLIAVAATAHMVGLTLSITPLLAPGIFNPLHSKGLVDAYLTFPPWPVASTVKASSIAEGSLWFLQYDYILTSWAYLIWSVSLRLASLPDGNHLSGYDIATHSFTALGRAIVLGPMGSAATLLWERDEDLLLTPGKGESRNKLKKGQ